ncbi:hypothetical protein GCM10010492_57550 [Saccharothrix mutabilis subsp. mutabilis]|uniref:Uncharacterized protein n=1 Tax=Saccharothrix mutabilis subsp. mutabilis TaxID=66855 RepID=A0ABP3E4M3_9PSEU
MIPVELVQWGGVAGGGFSPVDDGGLRRAPGPFRSVAQDLVHAPDGVPQPTPDLDARSALGLRVVPVPGSGSWWCFSVQVCGGRFGRTGVCQFLFAPADGTDAWRLWESCVAAVASGDGLLPWGLATAGLPADPEPVGAADAKPLGGAADAVTLVRVLTGLVEGHDAVRVDGAETEVAAAIAGALRVLPHAVARERVWTTFLAAAPGNPRLPRVTGAWPAALRGTATADRVDRWLDRKLALPSTVDDEYDDTAAAVRWLAARVREPAAVDRYRPLPTIGALVSAVVENELWRLEAGQVWPALQRGEERVLRAENEPQLVSWLLVNPSRAVEWLCGTAMGLAGEFADTVFRLLVRENPDGLGLPTDDPVWFDRSAELARRLCPTRDERVKLARSLTGDVRALGPWFEALGLDSRDADLADLFPVTEAAVVEEVTALGDLGPRGERLLSGSAEPAEVLLRLVAAVPPLSAGVAVAWLGRVGAESERRQLFRAVLGRQRFAGQASGWLLDALRSTEDGGVRDVVASLGAGAFGPGEPPSLELSSLCVGIAARSAEPASCFAVFLDVVRAAVGETHRERADRDRWRAAEAAAREAAEHWEREYRELHRDHRALLGRDGARGAKRKAEARERKAEAREREAGAREREAEVREREVGVQERRADAGEREVDAEERSGRHAVDHGRRLLWQRNAGVVLAFVVFLTLLVSLALAVQQMFHR